LPAIVVARGHAWLVRVEVRPIRREAVRALDVDHRQRMAERGGVVGAAQQAIKACRRIVVRGAELLRVVGV
jgi:hypothetical protein